MKSIWLVGVMAVGIVAVMAGCRSVHPVQNLAAEAADREVTFVLGTVRQVRASMGYVVLECVSLPLQGERVTVYRDGKVAAHLRVNGPVRMPYATADIVDGFPEVGDKVKTTRTRKPAVERGQP